MNKKLVEPIMQVHGVSRKEAIKRLDLLQQSGILEMGNPGDDHWKMMVDNFLAQDSKTLQATMNYKKALDECIANDELVKQYDRLKNRSFGKAIIELNAGAPPKDFQKQFEEFETFCQEFIFSRLPNN